MSMNRDTSRILNQAIDNFNQNDLHRINDKYKNTDLKDDKNNLAYTKEMRDAWLKSYRDVLAADLGTSSEDIKGLSWVDQMPFGHRYYTDILDANIRDLENKIKK